MRKSPIYEKKKKTSTLWEKNSKFLIIKSNFWDKKLNFDIKISWDNREKLVGKRWNNQKKYQNFNIQVHFLDRKSKIWDKQ